VKRPATLLALTLLLIVSTTTDAGEPKLGPPPLIVGHRGTCINRPECTLVALEYAIDVGAQVVEIDVRTSKDGVLFLLHDGTLDRTTDGTGPGNQRTMAELKELDAGGWLDEKYRGERIPTLGEALALCRDKIDVLLDLKEKGEDYAKAVARDVIEHGNPARTILGVHSVEQAGNFRRVLPKSRQLGFIAGPERIEAVADAGVDIIRLWPGWLQGGDGPVERVRKAGVKLQLNATVGAPRDALPLLRYRPEMLLVDDPAAFKATLDEVARHAGQFAELSERVEVRSDKVVVPWIAKGEALSFLNRDYHMLEFPKPLQGQPRLLFAGGEGDRIVLRFKEPAVVFAAFEYNTSGNWSFAEGHSPETFGWNLVKKNGYRGTSNPMVDEKPHYADLYCRSFEAGERLEGLPPWWLCVAIVDPEVAGRVAGYSAEAPRLSPPFLYSEWATGQRRLRVPEFANAEQWAAWQQSMRKGFQEQLVFPYAGPLSFVAVGKPVGRDGFSQQEFHVMSDGKRLFRFFKLTPGVVTGRRATIVCFMGHGKVRQILEEPDSYQHACAARFAERGYVVYAMENVGMGPDRDTHHELDRLLRLDGYGWYSLLFAHQQILLDRVFADRMVDTKRVGVTGVSTGGLLALSAIAMDPRVASASVQGIFGSMRVSFIEDRDRHCQCGAIPGLLPDFDLPEMALLAAPRPLHISNATQDGFGPAEARRQIERITPHYVAAGGEEPGFSSPPGHHEFAFEPALKFFEETIGEPVTSVSLDTNLTWVETPAGRPVIDRGPEGSWDHYAVDNPYVLVDGEELCCFYEAQDKPFEQGGGERIGLATSRDGIHWKKSEENPILDVGPPGAWDDVVAKLPAVTKHNGTYYMFYSGRDGQTKQIGLAMSSDRIHWKKVATNPVLSSRPDGWDRFLSTYPASVFVRGDRFFMVYRGMTSLYKNQAVGLAVSENLVDWTRAADEPVIPVGEDIASLAVTCTGDGYVGISQSPSKRFWLSKDLRTWTKGRPVKFTGPRVDTLSNPFMVGGQWCVVYEQQDRIYRAVLGEVVELNGASVPPPRPSPSLATLAGEGGACGNSPRPSPRALGRATPARDGVFLGVVDCLSCRCQGNF
jgi:predicted GH43/DUF377 family glycosyl hydrolase